MLVDKFVLGLLVMLSTSAIASSADELTSIANAGNQTGPMLDPWPNPTSDPRILKDPDYPKRWNDERWSSEKKFGVAPTAYLMSPKGYIRDKKSIERPSAADGARKQCVLRNNFGNCWVNMAAGAILTCTGAEKKDWNSLDNQYGWKGANWKQGVQRMLIYGKGKYLCMADWQRRHLQVAKNGKLSLGPPKGPCPGNGMFVASGARGETRFRTVYGTYLSAAGDTKGGPGKFAKKDRPAKWRNMGAHKKNSVFGTTDPKVQTFTVYCQGVPGGCWTIGMDPFNLGYATHSAKDLLAKGRNEKNCQYMRCKGFGTASQKKNEECPIKDGCATRNHPRCALMNLGTRTWMSGGTPAPSSPVLMGNLGMTPAMVIYGHGSYLCIKGHLMGDKHGVYRHTARMLKDGKVKWFRGQVSKDCYHPAERWAAVGGKATVNKVCKGGVTRTCSRRWRYAGTNTPIVGLKNVKYGRFLTSGRDCGKWEDMKTAKQSANFSGCIHKATYGAGGIFKDWTNLYAQWKVMCFRTCGKSGTWFPGKPSPPPAPRPSPAPRPPPAPRGEESPPPVPATRRRRTPAPAKKALEKVVKKVIEKTTGRIPPPSVVTKIVTKIIRKPKPTTRTIRKVITKVIHVKPKTRVVRKEITRIIRPSRRPAPSSPHGNWVWEPAHRRRMHHRRRSSDLPQYQDEDWPTPKSRDYWRGPGRAKKFQKLLYKDHLQNIYYRDRISRQQYRNRLRGILFRHRLRQLFPLTNRGKCNKN